MNEYIEKYPDDYKAKILYCEALVLCNDIDNARKIINEIPESYKYESVIYPYIKTKLLIYEENYEEVLRFTSDLKIDDIENELIKVSFKTLIFLSNWKTGKIDMNKLNIDNLTYSNKQIINYSEDLAIEHIYKHRNEINEKISIEDLFKLVKENIDETKINISLSSHDFYIFKYDKIGINEDYIYTDYLKVFVISNTNNILTIYPISPNGLEKNYHIIELDKIDLDYKKEKVKRISQIDKFNQKYRF